MWQVFEKWGDLFVCVILCFACVCGVSVDDGYISRSPTRTISDFLESTSPNYLTLGNARNTRLWLHCRFAFVKIKNAGTFPLRMLIKCVSACARMCAFACACIFV